MHFAADDPPYALRGPGADHLAGLLGRAMAEGDDRSRRRLSRMAQDPHVRDAVASARLEGVELDPAVIAILEAAAAGEMTTDQARRQILAEHGVDLPADHRLSQAAHAR